MSGSTFALPRLCHCNDGQSHWLIGDRDRFCSSCGRRLETLWELDLPLGREIGSGVACYFAPEVKKGLRGARLLGQVRLGISGAPGDRLEARHAHHDGATLRALELSRPSLGVVALDLVCDALASKSTGPIGRWTITIEGLGDPIEVPIQGYQTPASVGSVRMVNRPGEPPKRRVLSPVRGLRTMSTFLEFEPGLGTPARWDRLECPHAAVSVRLIDPEIATPVVRAEVTWDLLQLDPVAALQHVPFTLHLRGLARVTYVEEVRWRMLRSLRFRPPTVFVPQLDEGEARSLEVEVMNLDREPIRLLGVETDCSWIRPSNGVASSGVSLDPGERAVLELVLDPRALLQDGGSRLESLHVRLENRGLQRLQVQVGAVRRVLRLDTPLLIDLGPPRVIVARLDRETGRVVYPSRSGDAGLSPEALGVATEVYASAVFGGRDAVAVALRLVNSVVAMCRQQELWHADRILVCRHPWMTEVPLNGAFDLSEWTALPRLRTGAIEVIARVGAWRIDVVRRDAAGSVEPVLASDEGQPPAPGQFVREWLSSRLHPRLREPAGDPPPWLAIAAEALLVDYRRGPGFAWRRFARAWRDAVPEARHAELDPTEADEVLHRCLGEIVKWIGNRLTSNAAASERRGTVLLMGPVFRGERLSGVLESARQFTDMEFETDEDSWIERLAVAGEPSVLDRRIANREGRAGA